MSSKPSYRRDIDGLRALAVAAVVCYHAFPGVAPGGFVGVDVFFVISGYLISGLVLADLRAGAFTVRGFYARRIRRIFPALAVVLVACLAFGWLTLLPNEYDQLGQHVAGGGGFALNFLLWSESGYFDTAAELKPLLHLWSLGIEEQFYLVWPLLLLLASRLRRSPLLLVLPVLALSFTLNVRTVGGDAVAAFYSPATRLWELAAGSALACAAPWTASLAAVRRGSLSLLGLALVLLAVVVLRSDRVFPGWWAALPVAGAALVIAAGPDTWAGRLLSHRAAVFVGLISYPLYLWHWPALAFLRILSPGTPSLAPRIAAVAASGVAAWLTYRWIEHPLRFGRARRRSGAVIALALAMAAIAAAGFSVHALGGLPSRMPGPLRTIASADYDFTTDARVDRCWLGATAPFDGFAGECLDAGDARPLAVVWGDSHAARLYPGIRAVAPQARLAQYTRSSCAPLLDHGYEQCVASNAFVLGKIRALRPDVVILFAAWGQHSASWRPADPSTIALQRTVHTLHDLGVTRIVLVGPAPQWEQTLPRIMINASWRDPRRELPRRTTHGLNPMASIARWRAASPAAAPSTRPRGESSAPATVA